MTDFPSLVDVSQQLQPWPAKSNAAAQQPPICLLVEKKQAQDFLTSLDEGEMAALAHQGFPKNLGKIYFLTNEKKNNFVYLFEHKWAGQAYCPLSFSALSPLLSSLLNGQEEKTLPAVLLKFFKKPQDTQSIKNALYGVGFGLYDFIDFKKNGKPSKTIFYVDNDQFALENDEWQEIMGLITANHFSRQLINLPPNRLGPQEFEDFFNAMVKKMAQSAPQKNTLISKVIDGDQLKNGFPLIATVGQGSRRAPRLLELNWGNPADKKICLVGKGVCFDSGGLNLKSAGGMWLMKKDMAGAAIALGLAYLVITNNLPYRLQLLLPLAENMPDGNSYRPSDILTARNGTTIEVGDTDAEGRLLLADALSYGAEQQPDTIIDIATLTGAARVAVGTGISAFFCNDKKITTDIMTHGENWHDPMWPLPLHAPYLSLLSSNHADVSSTGNDNYAGAITTALFLQKFIADTPRWLHIDTMAWNLSGGVGNPIGGAAMSLLACYHLLKN